EHAVPNLTYKNGAYIVSPTFGEQFAQVLPGIVNAFLQAKQRRDDLVQRSTEIQAKYATMTPEVQEQLRRSPEFTAAYYGVDTGGILGRRKARTLSGPPVRDLTEEELLQRQKMQLRIQEGQARTAQIDQQTLSLPQEL